MVENIIGFSFIIKLVKDGKGVAGHTRFFYGIWICR